MATKAETALGQPPSPAHRAPCIRGSCAEHRIAIDAPVETVWAILMDFERWGEWNPLYVNTSGRLDVGQEIGTTVALPGMKPQATRAQVTLVSEPTCIEYATVQMGGLVRVHRYMDLKTTGPASCRLANGEIMGGPAGKLLARFVGAKVRQGLKGMNEALKARAELAGS